MEIVREGPCWVVVRKPEGLLSVPGKGEGRRDCVAARIGAMYPMAHGPLVVHRLDMDTSGLMVLGLTPKAQRDLSGQFERREVAKAYVALVEGRVEAEQGMIDLPMRLDVERRPHQVIDFERGRPALTRWRVLSYETDRTRLELRPETGRSHQLRVHCAAARSAGGLGHPIIGDVLYGEGVEVVGGRIARQHAGTQARSGEARRLMLHASALRFRCPETDRWIEVESPAPF